MTGLYKIQNGKLVTPPKIWKGVIGYNNNLQMLARDGWKPLIETGSGVLYKLTEKKDYIEKAKYNKVVDYKTARENAYNASGLTFGNIIDALLKAYDGNDNELKTIITQRQIIKNNIKKA